MKNKILIIGTFLSLNLLKAQTIDLTSPAQQVQQQIEAAFPYIAGVLFLVVVIFNLGHFIGENQDWKKGLLRILLFVIVLGIVVGLYSGVTSITL